MLIIDNYSKTVNNLHGDHTNFCKFIFSGEGYSTTVSIENTTEYEGHYWVAYQSLGFNILP